MVETARPLGADSGKGARNQSGGSVEESTISASPWAVPGVDDEADISAADTFGVGISAIDLRRRCRVELRALVSDPNWPRLVAHSQLRALRQALLEALPSYWLRRAEELDAARPSPGDFTGLASSQEVAKRDQGLAEAALNCRRHAWLMATYGLPDYVEAELDHVLADGGV